MSGRASSTWRWGLARRATAQRATAWGLASSSRAARSTRRTTPASTSAGISSRRSAHENSSKASASKTLPLDSTNASHNPTQNAAGSRDDVEEANASSCRRTRQTTRSSRRRQRRRPRASRRALRIVGRCVRIRERRNCAAKWPTDFLWQEAQGAGREAAVRRAWTRATSRRCASVPGRSGSGVKRGKASSRRESRRSSSTSVRGADSAAIGRSRLLPSFSTKRARAAGVGLTLVARASSSSSSKNSSSSSSSEKSSTSRRSPGAQSCSSSSRQLPSRSARRTSCSTLRRPSYVASGYVWKSASRILQPWCRKPRLVGSKISHAAAASLPATASPSEGSSSSERMRAAR
mmetsp:Transcript_16556/g.50121  ORF Transcript_16556/g.50121 Transcript_16556/m.50121 type:complete len:349 (+) Transcript_16556:467-1513(+)